MTEVACEAEEIRLDELVPALVLLLLLELLVRDVGDVEVEDEEEKAVFAFSAALFLTILQQDARYRVGKAMGMMIGRRTAIASEGERSLIFD